MIGMGPKDKQEVSLVWFAGGVRTEFMDLDKLANKCFNRIMFEMMRESLRKDRSDDRQCKRRVVDRAIIGFGSDTGINRVVWMFKAELKEEEGTVGMGVHVESMERKRVANVSCKVHGKMARELEEKEGRKRRSMGQMGENLV
jgi:hypothetical protein